MSRKAPPHQRVTLEEVVASITDPFGIAEFQLNKKTYKELKRRLPASGQVNIFGREAYVYMSRVKITKRIRKIIKTEV